MQRVGPIKVLLVDDSPTVRSILTRVLSSEPDIEVVGGAKDPFDARELIIEHRPDVIILDIEMPRMDGLTFLKKLRAHYPVPVIMCSGVAPANSQAALDAIAFGAIDLVAKPKSGGSAALARMGEVLADKIRAAEAALPPRPPEIKINRRTPSSFVGLGLDPTRYIIAIGASTGGTEAIGEVLSHAPADFPPVVMVQHMPAGFTASFAGRLNELSGLAVSEAVDGQVLEPGMALLARGEIQMRVRFVGGRFRVVYGETKPVNRHCPSVDVLFDSIASSRWSGQTIGVILTGMGGDGAKGLLNMREAGALTVGQDRRSCVVYGMPKVAADLGAVEHVTRPCDVPRTIMVACESANQHAAPSP